VSRNRQPLENVLTKETKPCQPVSKRPTSSEQNLQPHTMNTFCAAEIRLNTSMPNANQATYHGEERLQQQNEQRTTKPFVLILHIK